PREPLWPSPGVLLPVRSPRCKCPLVHRCRAPSLLDWACLLLKLGCVFALLMLSWLPMFPYRESHLVVFDNGPPRESLPNWFLVRHRPSISPVRNKHLRTVRLGGLHMARRKKPRSRL